MTDEKKQDVDEQKTPRARRDSKIVTRVETFINTHKVIAAAVALVVLGATGALFLSRYPTREEVDKRHQKDAVILKQLQELRERDAEITSTLQAVQKSAGETRDDIKQLLDHVLRNPPRKE